MRARLGGLACLAALAGASPITAQSTGTIKGVLVVTGERTPVQGARVSLVGTPYTVITNAGGAFAFTGLAAGHYEIRVAAIGFATVTSSLDLLAGATLDIEFNTEAEAVTLPEITVEERSTHGPVDWIRRRAEGRGRYIDRAAIERRNPATVPDLMRMVPGVRVECRNGLVCLVRMTRAPRGCNPAFFMDGVPSDPAIAYLTPVHEVEGVEIYSGPSQTPPELESVQARCGVVVIWTRTPPPPRPKEKKVAPADSAPAPPPSDTARSSPRL